jgi:hypothetical protein
MLRIVNEAEWIVKSAERASPLPCNRSFALMQPPADNHERRHLGAKTLGPRDDRADARPHASRGRRPAEIDAADRAAGQADGPRDAVIVRTGMQGANDGDAIGPASDLRKEFPDARAGNSRRHRRKRPPILHRRIRLRIPGIQLCRPAPEPQEDDRPRRADLIPRLIRLEMEQIRQRQAKHRRAADLQKLASVHPLTGALSALSEKEH